MTARLLFVDDEPEILRFFGKVFSETNDVVVARSADEAVQVLAADKDFAVVTTDLNMPGGDGMQLLKQVKKLAPNSVRMMLTGYATQNLAISALNRGAVFRFLTKPIDVASLRAAVGEATRRYELDSAERALMEQTVQGSVSMLMEVLALAHPAIFGRASAVHRLISRLCDALEIPDRWALETAALLSGVGLLQMRQDVLARLLEGETLNDEDRAHLEAQSAAGAALVRRVPRLEHVANCIELQFLNYDGSGGHGDQAPRGRDIPLGARMLRLANSYQNLRARGLSARHALENLQANPRHFDRQLLRALGGVVDRHERSSTIVSADLSALVGGEILARDIVNRDGLLVLRAGQEVSEYHVQRLRNLAASGVIEGTVIIRADR